MPRGGKSIYTWTSYEVDLNGCWIWDHSLDTDGYGRWYSVRVFKLFYKKYKGEVPKGLVLDHLCRNRKCVNPEHLEPVTQIENVRRGKVAKLNHYNIGKIKELYKSGINQIKIAKIYKINQSTVSRILNGLRWKGI